jgi:Predicted signal transduction protein with a C-terminal ATPase domain
LIIISFTVFLRQKVYSQIKDNMTYNDMQLCVKISENTDTFVGKIDEIIKKLVSDKSLLRLLDKVNSPKGSPTNYERLSYNRALNDITANDVTFTSFSMLNVYILSKNGNYMYAYNDYNSSSFGRMIRDRFDAGQLKNKQMVIYRTAPGPNDSEKQGSLSFFRSIYDIDAKMYGYVEVQPDYSELADVCNIGNTGEVIIMDNRGQVLYPAGGIDAKTKETLKVQKTPGSTGVLHDAYGNIYFYSRSDYTDLTVITKYTNSVLYSSLSIFERATFFFILAATLIALFLTFLFSKFLVKPINDLRDSVLTVSYHHMDLKDIRTNNNEIIMLNDAFQHILDELKIAVNREIESGKEEAKAKLVALQAQIAPHFIHNVLYTISISAQEQKMDTVISMCKQLSDMLRYTVNPSSEPVKLEHEMNCIANYLALQAKSYEDFLFYRIDLQDGTKDIKIPRLSIQPFVENSVQYAFQKVKPPYRIDIIGRLLEGGERWSVSVIDNGNGIEPEVLDKINFALQSRVNSLDCIDESERKQSGMCNLGIVNTVMRFRMLYGDGFRFSIGRDSGGGTRVYLEGDCSCRAV